FYLPHTLPYWLDTLSLHDALPIWRAGEFGLFAKLVLGGRLRFRRRLINFCLSTRWTPITRSRANLVGWSRRLSLTTSLCAGNPRSESTRLNSSHRTISYAVFCLKK